MDIEKDMDKEMDTDMDKDTDVDMELEYFCYMLHIHTRYIPGTGKVIVSVTEVSGLVKIGVRY
jgi:hypothetical protein